VRFTIALSLLLCTLGYSQERLDRFKPKEPPPLARTGVDESPDAASAARSGADASVGVPVSGIVFISALPEFHPNGLPSFNGVRTERVPVIDNADFRTRVSKFLGRPISMTLIEDVGHQTMAYFKEHDRPVVRVIAPQQDVTTGVIQFLVTEGHVGQINVAGNRWFRSSLFKTRLHPGDPIIMSQLEADTAFYGRNPFRSVTAELGAGKEAGKTDVTLRVQDKFPLRVFLGYDNSGVKTTGENRLFAGFNYGNLFGLGQELSYQFTTSDDFERLLAHSATWTVPLPWMHVLQLSGVYSESKPELPEGFDSSGESWQVGGRYVIPLPSVKRIKHELSLGYDFKFTDNNVQFGGEEVFDTPVEISEFNLSYNALRSDSLGSTSLALTAFWSPGGMSQYNDDESFEAARQGSSADYYYFTGGLDRVTKLPWGMTWSFSARVQWSNSNLPATEQFLLGGQSTVRGYDELVAAGDSGFLVRNEIYTPPFSIGRSLRFAQIGDQLQFLVFHDFGTTYIADPLENEDDHVALQSAGLGLRWQVRDNVALRFDYGWQIEDIGLEDSSRAHLGVTVSF
jgi:hemolysin activation/secretion protein